MVNVLRKWWVWPIIILLGLAILFALLPSPADSVDVSPQRFVDDVRSGRVDEVKVDGRDVDYKLLGDDNTYRLALNEGDTIDSVLREGGLDAGQLPRIRAEGHGWWKDVPFYTIAFLPPILIVAVLVALLRWLWRKGSAVKAGG